MPINENCQISLTTRIPQPELVNLYGCSIGPETSIGPFVEIQNGVTIGDKCKIQSHSFICEGVTIEDQVFIGHGVIFTNDRYPAATNRNGNLKGLSDWNLEKTIVRRGAAIGSGSTILPGVEIGESAIVGAGSVVASNVEAGSTVHGNPATTHSVSSLNE